MHPTEAVLTKEHSRVKDLEQELKDLKSHLQLKVNASMLPLTTLVTAELKLQVVVPAWSLPQPEAGPSQLPPPQPEAGPSCLPSSQKETRPACPSKSTSGVASPWKWTMSSTGWRRPVTNW